MGNTLQKKRKFSAYQLYYHGMMLPGFIFLIIFNFIPMFGVIMAFQDFKPAKGFLGSAVHSCKNILFRVLSWAL